jgi:hypothetical protein
MLDSCIAEAEARLERHCERFLKSGARTFFSARTLWHQSAIDKIINSTIGRERKRAPEGDPCGGQRGVGYPAKLAIF